MPPISSIDNPGSAARSIERWFHSKLGIEISARQVQAYWVYDKEWEAKRREAGKPFTNNTATVEHPSQVAIDVAEFLTGKGIAVSASQMQALWKHHKEWQTSPERRAEREQQARQRSTDTSLEAGYFVLNQREVQPGDDGYDDIEGHRYHWTSQSSGAWKRLSQSPGARFVYYRPRTASDGTAQSYFGTGVISDIAEPRLGEFVATVSDFEKFGRPVPSDEGPTANHQTSILPISQHDFEQLVRLGSITATDDELTLDAVRDAATKAHLRLDDSILAQLTAALLSDKHVILTGPPGTAKTTLAQAVAEAAQRAGLCSGFMPTTATADWTTYETIGGLRPHGPDRLEFHEGHFLQAIRSNQWLLIDELNRSQFDRAFGQLFTVLSGQPVALPFSRPEADGKSLVLLPDGAESPIPDADVLQIPGGWRIIATMNVFDKSLLFEMSFALMRRFAFIEVASPATDVFEQLIDENARGATKAAELAKALLVVRDIKDLGPAVFIDLTKYLRERLTVQADDDGQLLFESFYSYLLPQFEGIDAPTGEHLFGTISPMMTTPARRDRLRRTLNSVLGLELSPAARDAHNDAAPEDESYSSWQP